jgi:WD40 repeat protein
VKIRLGSLALLFPFLGFSTFAQTSRTLATLETLVPMRSAITCEKGAIVFATGTDGAVYIWTLPSGVAHKITPPESPIRRIACGPGKTLALGYASGHVFLLDAESGDSKQHMDAQFPVQSLSFSRDGSLVAIATNGLPTQLWDIASGKRLAIGVTNLGASWFTAFSPAGDVFISADEDTYIRAYDCTGKLLYKTESGLLESFSVVFTPDGKQFAVAGADGRIYLYQTATGKKLYESAYSGNAIWMLCMFPDSRQVVAMEVDDFTLVPTAAAFWDMRSEKVSHPPVKVKDFIGFGANGSDVLVLRQEGPQTLTITTL